MPDQSAGPYPPAFSTLLYTVRPSAKTAINVANNTFRLVF
ncbi:hypothetical protein B4123_1538 [Bacillus paralicheniformis]|uniref:Uncharacterized protein n=1 Tax=Bacillus paralicheniformis TaxID=1648923 RepID=A0A6I7TKV6_9BACI|nr:hypothetical protein B4121_4079 [Bacillus paralicheniformis]OLG07121.1 hypothetical protein B4125_1302 [Bacillus paralicheniformis]OLG12078.1 hypothetical protein B4123_1538 [Bacillus paralicheniformis]TWJ50878.1 hypothetical protein CHCC5022_0667 [Bacillus paralicheniformis]TWJ55736.1 hypothetical protein CHCC5023_2340 [Bacillus paralicheniformis]